MSDAPDAEFGSGPGSARSIGGAVEAYLASEGLSTVKLLASLAADWSRLVGDELAAHSAPRAVDGAELVVAVDHPSRVAALAFVSARICDHLADQVGRRVIERVKGRVDARFGLQ